MARTFGINFVGHSPHYVTPPDVSKEAAFNLRISNLKVPSYGMPPDPCPTRHAEEAAPIGQRVHLFRPAD
jgi:hypothetical protein